MKQPLFEYDDEADEITVDFGSGTRRVELYVNANKVASLRAEVEALKQERDKWHHRAKMLWEGYRLTEQMNMPEIERWFRGEGEN